MAASSLSYAPVDSLVARRAVLQKTPPSDFPSLRRCLLNRIGGGHQLAPLQQAITAFESFLHKSSHPHFNFFSDLLPHIHSWALDAARSTTDLGDPHGPINLSLLLAGADASTSISRGTIRTLLSNAFFLNVLPYCGPSSTPQQETPRFGNLSLMSLYTSKNDLAKERLLCLLAYFFLAVHFKSEELTQEVVFERHVLHQSDVPEWQSLTEKISVNTIRIHTERMENSHAQGIMDFANKAIHIHKIIPSATQEEILFSTCPEAFVSILISEMLLDNEVIVIRNVRRFVEYEGYASGFRFAGFYPSEREHDILVADATQSYQFSTEMMDRDLNKAYLAFSAMSSSAFVSTSHWGCGAFGGDKHLKFLQQVCASALAGIALDYSTFGEKQTANSFKQLLYLISSNEHTIGSVYRAMCGYGGKKGSFYDYVVRNLDRNPRGRLYH